MNTADPAALQYFLQDDLYLLKQDKEAYAALPTAAPAHTHQAAVIEKTVATPAIEFKYLGKNQKSFLIVVYYPEAEFMMVAHLTALNNTLKAKGLTTDDVAIFNLAVYSNAKYSDIITYFNPQRVVLLGNDTLITGAPALSLNKPEQTAGYTTLYSFSFNEMLGNKDKTRAFWEQMKNL